MKPEPHPFETEQSIPAIDSKSIQPNYRKPVSVPLVAKPAQWLINLAAAVLFR